MGRELVRTETCSWLRLSKLGIRTVCLENRKEKERGRTRWWCQSSVSLPPQKDLHFVVGAPVTDATRANEGLRNTCLANFYSNVD